jgi:hypothetical protein
MTSSTAGPGTNGAGVGAGADSFTACDTFALGWQMTELRNHKTTAPSTAVNADGELPGLSRLKQRCANAVVLLAQLNAGIVRLRDSVPSESRGTLETARAQVATAFGQICSESAGDAERRSFADAVETLHEAIVAGLLSADYRMAKAYSLGAKLAWISQAPAAGWNAGGQSGTDAEDGDGERSVPTGVANPTGTRAAEGRDAVGRAAGRPEGAVPTTLGQGRLAQARKHLTDLGTVLPEHASRAVQLSAGAWAEWDRTQTERLLSAQAAQDLARQGEIWRSLLSHEKDGTDMLATKDYERAGQLMFEQTKQMVSRFIADHVIAVCVLAIIVVLAVIGLVVASATSQVIAALGVLLASAGVTWKAATTTLGDVAQRLGTPMWGAQLDRAIAEAITALPDPGVEELATTWTKTEAPNSGRRTRRRNADFRAAWWQHIADTQRPSGPAPRTRPVVRVAHEQPRRRLSRPLARRRRGGRETPKATTGRRA